MALEPSTSLLVILRSSNLTQWPDQWVECAKGSASEYSNLLCPESLPSTINRYKLICTEGSTVVILLFLLLTHPRLPYAIIPIIRLPCTCPLPFISLKHTFNQLRASDDLIIATQPQQLNATNPNSIELKKSLVH